MLSGLKQRLIYLDFESYYDDDYSLRKMTPAEYILDKRFETIMCAVREDDSPAYIVDGPDFDKWVADAQPTRDVTTTVTFNALFDNCILAWKYGYVPRRMLDALGMARTLLGHKSATFNLARVSQLMGLPPKGTDIHQVKGMNRAAIQAAGLWPSFSSYALRDVDNCAEIFKGLLPQFPETEQRVMDLTLRTTVEPEFHVDRKMLVDHIEALRKDKDELLTRAGVARGEVMSTGKFIDALKFLGVEPEYKVSPTGRKIPAIAKTDDFMYSLTEHEDPAVQALAAARLGLKSTLEETRALTYLRVSMLPWNYRPGNIDPGAAMVMPLRYGGAHTHRLSGDWKMNCQNLTRGGKIRKALKAAPGFKCLAADLGQIEARVTGWICGQDDLTAAFERKADVYSEMASEIFGRPVNRKLKEDEIEGFIGKGAILGLGYGMGDSKFYVSVIRTARSMVAQGLMTRESYDRLISIWTTELALRSKEAYRRKNNKIVSGWYALDQIISSVWLNGGKVQFGPCVITKGEILLPNGMSMHYANPRQDPETGDYLYDYNGRSHKMYGAKMLENIVQALSRIIIMNVALRMATQGYKFKQQAHDELVYIVPDADVDNAKTLLYKEMTRRPSWAPTLPLAAEVKYGQSYGDAK